MVVMLNPRTTVTRLIAINNNQLYYEDMGMADEKVKIDAAANAGYLGAASNDGVLRTGAGLSYTDGGDFITLAVDQVLEDLDTLGAPASDGQFIVATGVGAFAYEKDATVRTSLGLGTGNSPSFAGLTLSSPLSIGNGGTGVTTALAAFDALCPTGTKGDLVVYGGSSASVALGVGTNDYVLTADSTQASGMKWAAGGGGASIYAIPSMRLDTYNHADFVGHLGQIHDKNVNIEFEIRPYTHGLGGDIPEDNAYRGAVYSPTQNRIYLIPFNQGDVAKWHYVDCNDGSIVAYSHGITAVNGAYVGGVYSPTQNRIYLIPYGQADVVNWHYIDCDDGSVNAYAHGLGADIPVDMAYIGGVYSPNQNRIYLVPYTQGNQAKWHYIDCSDGTVVAYTHGATAVSGAYQGGVYSPTQDRIYFVPYSQADQTNWHFVDCSDGSIDAYAHGLAGDTPGAGAYIGGVYSPTQNRIYFVPHFQADVAKWHYIDCSGGSAVAYVHGATAGNGAYAGGVYSPTQDKIYFVPYIQANNATWHYMDCSDGSVVAYTHGATVDSFGYFGGIYSPTQNEIYFAPYKAANDAAWHVVKEFSLAEISPSIAASPLFNKL